MSAITSHVLLGAYAIGRDMREFYVICSASMLALSAVFTAAQGGKDFHGRGLHCPVATRPTGLVRAPTPAHTCCAHCCSQKLWKHTMRSSNCGKSLSWVRSLCN